MLRFPDGFIWGAATAGHQVEGGNVSSDCWALEHARPSFFRGPSGDAVDQYHRFGEDVAILAGLGLKAYRFSIEWARIEPEESFFSQAALDHYQRCIDACAAHGVLAALTFQHFTLPLWQARRGGFTDAGFADRFARFCDHAAGRLRGFDIACTLNELNLPVMFRDIMIKVGSDAEAVARRVAAATILGGSLEHFFLATPPQALAAHGIRAHGQARDAIKAHHPGVKVGITVALQDEQAEQGAEALRDQRREEFYDAFLDAAVGDDFIGVQTYTRVTVRKNGTFGPEPGHALTTMGYEDRPQALAETCRYVWERTKTPIIITENGWAGDDDARRAASIRDALTDVHAAIADGVDIRGYFYWSLLDNYEWLLGYDQKFGLIAVDRTTQQRAVKPSAAVLGSIARANGL